MKRNAIISIMINKTSMEQITQNGALRDIPVLSPYYDRIHALVVELKSTQAGSQEVDYLVQQIKEMRRRAFKRMEILGTNGIFTHL